MDKLLIYLFIYLLQITDETQSRWEVPLEIQPPSGGNTNQLYELQFTASPFSFRVLRRSTNTVLFNSAAGKLTFSDQFLSMSWTLPSENLYGIGENEQRSFKHDFGENLKWTMWAADQPPYVCRHLIYLLMMHKGITRF
jgi:hypothetical protein